MYHITLFLKRAFNHRNFLFLQLQAFSANVAIKEGEMEIAVGFGRSLLHSDRITSEKSKGDLAKDLDAYSQRKERINNKVKERTAR